ncbi:hypothetical protein AKO1_005044 [Acrasis kona]|uniref:Uncharacterized protein n=1 Tax=Acrasis kona TaxID=1008807 RepID=A0AAW2Z3J3_9EUKA
MKQHLTSSSDCQNEQKAEALVIKADQILMRAMEAKLSRTNNAFIRYQTRMQDSDYKKYFSLMEVISIEVNEGDRLHSRKVTLKCDSEEIIRFEYNAFGDRLIKESFDVICGTYVLTASIESRDSPICFGFVPRNVFKTFKITQETKFKLLSELHNYFIGCQISAVFEIDRYRIY